MVMFMVPNACLRFPLYLADLSWILPGKGLSFPVNQNQPPEVFYKKGPLKNFAKFTCLKNAILLKLVQVFSHEFCKTFKNTCLTEHFWMTATD